MDEEMVSSAAGITPVTEKCKNSKPCQIIMGLIANLVVLSPGMSLGFSAVALPQMMKFDNIDEHQASWIASLAAISTPVGCVLSGPVLDRLGRRVAMLAVNVPCLLGWVLLATAPQNDAITQIYIGRVLTGFGAGLASIPATVYLAEVAEPSLRGMLVTWTSIFISFGILLVYILGYCIKENWRVVCGISAVLPVIATLCVIKFLPESPVWLVSKEKVKEAEISLRQVRAIKHSQETPKFIQDELDFLILARSQENKACDTRSFLLDTIKCFTRHECFRPLLIMNIFFFFQQFSGIFVVVFYAVDIVNETGIEIDNYLVAVLIGLTRFLITIFISYASTLYGRRPLSIISGSGMTLSMGSLATYLFFVNNKLLSSHTINKLNWYPIFALIMYILMSTIGFLTIPFAMIGEIFPARIRGVASGITTCCGYIYSFIIVKLYPDMLRTIGMNGLFLLYAVMSMIGTCFVFLFLPETHGKSLRDIGELFCKKDCLQNKNVSLQKCTIVPNEIHHLTSSVVEGEDTNLNKHKT